MHTKILTEAKNILSDEDKWTKYTWARDSNGDPCAPAGNLAVKWSIDGAMFKAAHGLGYSPDAAAACIDILSRHAGKVMLKWHDLSLRKFKHVIQLLDLGLAGQKELS